MYEDLYSNNFFLNFLPSFIFLFSLILISFSNIYIFKKNIVFFGKYQPLVIFFSLFAIFTFIFNLIIIFNQIYLLNYFIFFYIIFFLYFLLKKKNKLILINKKIINLYNPRIIILFFLFFFISILPLSDVDSVAVHLRSAAFIYNNGLDSINLFRDYEFLSISNSEILLLLSPILKSDNFGNQLNFFSILIFYFITKKNITFFEFLFSCPLFVFLISTQKLQLFFALIFLFLFILIHENKIKSKFEIFLFVFLLSFYSSGKIYYVFFSLLLVAYFLFKNKKSYKYFFSFGIVNFVFIFLPIFFLKYKYFGNPLAPFFDEILGNSRYVFIKYAFALRESQGWISNYDNLLIYIKPFIPTKIADLTNTLGLIFLLLLLNFKLQKNLKFFPIFIILIIASTGNILSRYFFEAFLLLSFYYINERNSLINLIKNLQLLIIFCFVTSYLYISYVNYNVIGDKNRYMNNFSYSYYNNKKYASLSNENKILTLSQDRANIFYSDNIIPRSYLRMKGIDKGQNLDLINFVNENNISYIILIPNEKNLLPNCLTDNLVGDINEHKASRNFLVKSGELTHIYKVNENKC